MTGGCDSYNVLVPYSDCIEVNDDGDDLHQQYQDVRQKGQSGRLGEAISGDHQLF